MKLFELAPFLVLTGLWMRNKHALPRTTILYIWAYSASRTSTNVNLPWPTDIESSRHFPYIISATFLITIFRSTPRNNLDANRKLTQLSNQMLETKFIINEMYNVHFYAHDSYRLTDISSFLSLPLLLYFHHIHKDK